MRNGPSLRGKPRLASFLLLAMVVGLACWLPAQGHAAVPIAPDREHSAASRGEPGHVGACTPEAVRAATGAWLPVALPATLTDMWPLSPVGSPWLAAASEARQRDGTPPLFLLHAALLI